MAKKINNDYILIIDDTATEKYKKKQKRDSIVLYIIIGWILSSIPAILIGVKSNSTIILVATWLIMIIAFVTFAIIYDKKHAIKQPEKEKITKKQMDENKLKELKTTLERVKYVTASICGGFVATPTEMKKYELLPPAYGAIKNPPIRDYNFIRVPNDLNDYSEKEKRIIEEAFGFTNNNVIWFSAKSINKWTEVSLIKTLKFIDSKGNKMYFMHTRYSDFKNLRELSVVNGTCQIHIIN